MPLRLLSPPASQFLPSHSRPCAPLRAGVAAASRPLVPAASVRPRLCAYTLRAATAGAVRSGQGGTVGNLRAAATVRSGAEAGGVGSQGLRFRRGTEADAPYLKSALRKESMNPLGVQTSRFVIVEDTGSGATLGFGQLEPKTAAAKAGTGAVLELRSMVVEPGSRGRGIGTCLMAHLLEGIRPEDEVWLTTIGSRRDFYRRAGFVEVEPRQFPRWIWLEAALGTVMARLAVGEQLVVMCRAAGQ